MTNETLKNPSVIIPPDLTDLDKAIGKLQTQIGTYCPWIEKVFGRAKEQPSMQADKSISREPMVYQGSREYYPVLPNDALKSYSFFRTIGARTLTEWTKRARMYATTNVDLIVWLNLRKVDPTKDWIFTEELINQVLNVINQKNTDARVITVWDEKVEDIFRGYTLNPTHRDLLMYPYQAFRIEMALEYQLACEQVVATES